MTMHLNTNSEKLGLIDYSYGEDTFQFTFKRPKQISPDEKLGVEFVHPRIDRVAQRAHTQAIECEENAGGWRTRLLMAHGKASQVIARIYQPCLSESRARSRGSSAER
jgi:hypothetical protein